jgi:dipeptidase E
MKFLSLVVMLGFLVARGVSAPVEVHTSPRASVIVNGGSTMKGDFFADAVEPVMREHYKGCRLVALVLHASHPGDFDRTEARLQKAFAHLGDIRVESLHHHDEAGAKALLKRADGIFVGGGETFVLLRELHRRGELELIRERVLAGVPFAGSSAGANVAGVIVGTTNDFPTSEIPTRVALGFLPATINPHHPVPDTKADYDARVGKIRGYLRFNPDETVLALANAATVRLHEGRVVLAAGRAWIYQASGSRELVLGEPIPELAPVKPAAKSGK